MDCVHGVYGVPLRDSTRLTQQGALYGTRTAMFSVDGALLALVP